MKKYEFGNLNADIVLIQPVDEYDLAGMENEISLIASEYGNNFRLIAIKMISGTTIFPLGKLLQYLVKKILVKGLKKHLTKY